MWTPSNMVAEAVGAPLGSAFDIARVLRPHADEANADQRERFWVLMLDVKQRLVAPPYLVALGSLTACVVHPRETFREAVRMSAVFVIVAHNHPSGDPSPSQEDVAITRRLVWAGELMGIRVLDHVVLGHHGSYHSFADSGFIKLAQAAVTGVV